MKNWLPIETHIILTNILVISGFEFSLLDNILNDQIDITSLSVYGLSVTIVSTFPTYRNVKTEVNVIEIKNKRVYF